MSRQPLFFPLFALVLAAALPSNAFASLSDDTLSSLTPPPGCGVRLTASQFTFDFAVTPASRLALLNDQLRPHPTIDASIVPLASVPDDLRYGSVGYAPLSVDQVLHSYASGAFALGWSHDLDLAKWVSPPERGLLFLKDFRLNRSALRFLRSPRAAEYEVTFDAAFDEVIDRCALQKRLNPWGWREDTWITSEFQETWKQLFGMGNAHSLEVWHRPTGELVAGMYGTFVAGVFTGESMFHSHSDVAKLMFVALRDRLLSNGHEWWDVEMSSMEVRRPDAAPRSWKPAGSMPEVRPGVWLYEPLAVTFGARAVPRAQYLRLLSEAQKKQLPF